MRFTEHGITKYFELKRNFELKFHFQENIGKKQLKMKTNVSFDDLQFWLIFWIGGVIVAFAVFIGEILVSKKNANILIVKLLIKLFKYNK